MAQQELKTRITADSSGFVNGVNQAQAASNKFTKANRRQSQSFTQLAYALDDAQYGFRGVQNNLQQLAVTAGASGPVVLGITAVLVVMGHLISKFEGANVEMRKAEKNFKNLTKLVLSSDKQIIRDGEIIAEQKRKDVELLKKQLENGKEVLYIRKDGTAALRELSEGARKQKEEELSAANEALANAEKHVAAAKKRIKYAKELKEIKASEDITPFASELGLDFKDDGLHDVFDIQGSDFGLLPDPDVIEEQVDDINDLLRELGSPLADLTPKLAEDLLNFTKGLEDTKLSVEDFTTSLIGAFESAATQGGSFLENLGKGLLSAIGSMLIQWGTANIIQGKLALASPATAALAPGLFKSGAIGVAAGVALKAGSSITGGGSAAGGGVGSTGSAISAGSYTANATQTQGRGGSDRMIGELKLRGQDLVVALQSANRNYNNF